MSKPIIMERKARPAEFSEFFLLVFGTDWKRYKRYETVECALQAYESILHSSWNTHFDYRLVTPVGIVALPVVKA